MVCYYCNWQLNIRGYDGIGRHARFRFSCFTACRFDPCYPHHVVASFVSLATTFYSLHQKPSRAHSAAPPFQIEPTSLGFDLVFTIGAISVCLFAMRLWLCGAFGKIPVFNDRLIKGDKTNEKSNCSAVVYMHNISGMCLRGKSI